MPAILLAHERLDLPLAAPWTISRGTRRVAENVLRTQGIHAWPVCGRRG